MSRNVPRTPATVVEIDRRMLRRRAEVAEGRTRSSLSRLGLFLLFALFVGLPVWVLRSPLLAVDEINIEGALPNQAGDLLARTGINLGQPLVTVRLAEVEANLESDPRVLASEVVRRWPNEVLVMVTPRLPVAWIADGAGWSLVGVDGVVLETAGQPGSGMPTVIVDPSLQASLLGGLEFVAHIDPLLFTGAMIEMRGEELWGNVGGYEVRLGRAMDMAEKARALNTILRQSAEFGSSEFGPLVPGSLITLIAPARPAISIPAHNP